MSDHISGPRALAEPIADITDLYAFPSPERSGHLVLVLNTRPFAGPTQPFSNGLIYRLRLRFVTVAAPGQPGWYVAGGKEFSFDCTFSDPEVGRSPQEGLCVGPSGETLTFTVNDADGGSRDDIRVFAGPRWDPFIMDAPAALNTIATGRLAFSEKGSIYLDGKNVLSVVIEFDCAKLLPGARLLAVVGETLTRGPISVRLERTGRPEVKNLMLAPKQFDQVNRDLEIRDLYNMEDAFQVGPWYAGAYRARMNANLAFWDGLDGAQAWPPDEQGDHPLTRPLLDDHLLVDVTKPYAEHGSFLEIERARLKGESHRTCGGRALNDDAMDTLFTLLVNGGEGPTIRDGVDRSTRPASRTFPYLAPPNPDPPIPPEHH